MLQVEKEKRQDSGSISLKNSLRGSFDRFCESFILACRKEEDARARFEERLVGSEIGKNRVLSFIWGLTFISDGVAFSTSVSTSWLPYFVVAGAAGVMSVFHSIKYIQLAGAKRK